MTTFFKTYKHYIYIALISLIISGGGVGTVMTYASMPNEIDCNTKDIRDIKEILPLKVNVKTYKANNLSLKEQLNNKVEKDYLNLLINNMHDRFDDSDQKLDIAIKLLNNNRLSHKENSTLHKICNK